LLKENYFNEVVSYFNMAL